MTLVRYGGGEPLRYHSAALRGEKGKESPAFNGLRLSASGLLNSTSPHNSGKTSLGGADPMERGGA
jgi:hypothetical protein